MAYGTLLGMKIVRWLRQGTSVLQECYNWSCTLESFNCCRKATRAASFLSFCNPFTVAMLTVYSSSCLKLL